MAVGSKQVTPAVVVVVQEDRAPSEKRHGNLLKSGLPGYVAKELSLVPEQRVMVFGVGGNEQIRSAVVVGVADGNSHIRLFYAIGTAGDPHRERVLFEFASAQIAVKIVEASVIGDEDIRTAVSIQVLK